jgi:hypothetical protein
MFMATQPIEIRESNPQITINPDGTFSPDPVDVNNGGLVKFQVSSYPPGTTECYIRISVTFPGEETKDVAYAMSSSGAAAGTIKIGS